MFYIFKVNRRTYNEITSQQSKDIFKISENKSPVLIFQLLGEAEED